jgi:hypothetical protein
VNDRQEGFFRPEFLAEHERAIAKREPVHDAIWSERQETSQLVKSLVPEAEEFFDFLEARDDIPSAIGSGGLVRLEAEGYVQNTVQFISAERLKRNARVWSLRLTSEGVIGVDRSGDAPKPATQWDEIVLQAKVDNLNRRIDTEFFGLNEALGDSEPTFDDREKLHIVWQLGEKDNVLSLYYVGFGANEPYDLEHEDKGAGFSGRPRFFIYDVERKKSVRYEVDWTDASEFDWDWSTRPVRVLDALRREVEFVKFHDGCRVCLSDTEMAKAADGYTFEKALAEAARQGMSVTEDEVRAGTRRLRAVVTGPIVEALPKKAPSLQALVDRSGFDYVAYFVAATIAGEKPSSASALVKAVGRLEPSRRAEYEAILKRSPKEVFVDSIAQALPVTMRELFDSPPEGLDETAQAAILAWTTKIASEVRRDLYYYGQAPLPRMNRLRLAAHLAFSKQHGDMYAKVIEQAKRLLLGETPWGDFTVSLAPV